MKNLPGGPCPGVRGSNLPVSAAPVRPLWAAARVHKAVLHVQSVCVFCNSHKGPNLTGIDPDSGAIVRLFNPRQDRWADHFTLRGAFIIGLTPTGRTTVYVLAMNARHRL